MEFLLIFGWDSRSSWALQRTLVAVTESVGFSLRSLSALLLAGLLVLALPNPACFSGRSTPRRHALDSRNQHDGYRCQVVIEQGHTRVFTGNGYNWSDRYPSIIQAAANLRCQSAIIDGEAILPDGNGVADFDSLNSAMRWCPASIILYAFDLMHLDGADLRRESLTPLYFEGANRRK